jgi:hypothetical protein
MQGTSGRSDAMPLGRRLRYVTEANAMVSRMALLAMIGLALSIDFILEQPLSSLMPRHPRLEALQEMSALGAVSHIDTVHTWMGSYGHWCPKPTLLMGTVPWLGKMIRKWTRTGKSSGTTHYYIDDSGAKKFTASKLLKGTQAYPPQYGNVCATHICKARVTINVQDSDSDFDYDILSDFQDNMPDGADMWADALIGGVWTMVVRRKCSAPHK